MDVVQMVSRKHSSLKNASLKPPVVRTIHKTYIPKLVEGTGSLQLSICWSQVYRSPGSCILSMTSTNRCLWSFLLKWKVVQKRFLSGFSGYNYIEGDLDFTVKCYSFLKLKRLILSLGTMHSL